MKRSAVVLAGGSSTRFGQDKAFLTLKGLPLVEHVLDAVKSIVDECILVVSSPEQVDRYSRILDAQVVIYTDESDSKGPLKGAHKGFTEAQGEYTLLLPCDTPFVSRDVASLMLDLCVGRNAAIPRWPNCQIEPLQAVYRTKASAKAAEEALGRGDMKMQGLIDRLQMVRYVSTLVIEQIDPQLMTFFNINTALDLKKAEAMLKSREA